MPALRKVAFGVYFCIGWLYMSSGSSVSKMTSCMGDD